MPGLRKAILKINGVERMIICDPEKESLSDMLRRIGLTGVKVGCGVGVCGSCSVILNGEVIRSCTKKMKYVTDYSHITTVEGIGTAQHLHPLQVAFMNCGAVQCGFCSPGFIVSAYGLLQKNPSPTREDVRAWFHKHKNVCRCTGYKQIVDAVMAAAAVMRGELTVEDITYQLPADGNYYGQPMVRPAALGKVTGVTDYGEDMSLKMPEGTLHLAIVQPKITNHARIKGLDFTLAEQVPGVVRFITWEDVRGTNHLQMSAANSRSTTVRPEHIILCKDKIYRWGDVVALVAADTRAHARQAAALVKVEIEQLPEYMNYLDAVMPGAQRIHEDTPNLMSMQPVFKGVEDVAQLIDDSAYSVEGSFYSSRQPHMSIEGDPMQAYFDEDDNLTIHCKSQGIYAQMNHIAPCVGIDPAKLRMVMNPSGASFGWSTNAASYALIAIAAMTLHQPVSLCMSYEEHQHLSGKRSPAFSNARLACDAQGKITGAEFDFGMDHGAFNDDENVVDRPARFSYFGYNIPNLAGLSRIANTNHAFGTSYRSFGAPQSMTMSEAMIDMLAEKAGIDPFEFRRINVARPGDLNLNGYPYKDYPMSQMLDVLEPYYKQAMAEAKAADTPAKRRGVGLAFGGYNVSEGPGDAAEVAIELMSDGTFRKYDTWEDLGQGGDVGSLQVTLEALKPLGVKPAQIQLVQNDSKYCPDTGMASSSRLHYMSGLATQRAAKMLMDAMRKDDGTYRTYDEMMAEGLPTKYSYNHENTSYNDPKTGPLCDLNPNTGKGDPTPAYTYALFMAEVEVDTATGKTRILRFICVDDVGVIGNIASVDGQAYGGIAHSIGFALSENYEDIKKCGNIAGCGIPYNQDIPDDIQLIHLQNPRKEGPWGSSGASEAFQSSGHMAVINAISNACGVRIYELPATADKVKAGLDILANGGKINPPSRYYLGSDFYDQLEEIRVQPV